jgi:hypothetical protein
MWCLYCGKELALLKRLTGGNEFCSDAHRKKYQEEFNDLALNRLLQSHPKGLRQLPAPEDPPPPQVVVPAAASAAEEPEMAGFLIEVPAESPAPPITIQWGELFEMCPPQPKLPLHDFRAGSDSFESNWSLAKPVAFESRIEPRRMPARIRKNSIEPREFSRHGELQFPQQTVTIREWKSASWQKQLDDGIVEFRRPAESPQVWLALARSFTVEPVRLDFDVIRSSEALDEPPAAPVPRSYTNPSPVTLEGVSPGIAKPVDLVGAPSRAKAAALPAPQGLPLRPSIVLKAASKPVPARLTSAATVPNSTSSQRRPVVRTIPIKQEVPKPPVPVQTAPTPSTPPEPKPRPVSPAAELGLPELHVVETKGIWGRMPAAVKIGMAAVIMLAIGGGAYLTLNSTAATAKPVTQAPKWELGRQINTNGWIDDWAPADLLRRVTLLRGSEHLTNYRLEFTAQIQTKAIGWMFRGLNPKNYYVAKIEKLKPGINPVVAFVRYAVIDGKNETRIEKLLPMKVRVDTGYKIRFDAEGSKFTVWVLGEKIDEWEDPRLGSGGLGLYSEGDEAPAMQGAVQAWELVSNNSGQ